MNTFVDKHGVIKKMYYVGLAVNCYVSYRCVIKIIALGEVEEHLEQQLRKNLERRSEKERRDVEEFLREKEKGMERVE